MSSIIVMFAKEIEELAPDLRELHFVLVNRVFILFNNSYYLKVILMINIIQIVSNVKKNV
jgi:hypothetical protein